MARVATLLFGYLAVAYFAGANLSRMQASILTGLYQLWQLRLETIVYSLMGRAHEIQIEMASTTGSTAPSAQAGAAINLHIIPLIVMTCALASVYFMWDIRRNAASPK